MTPRGRYALYGEIGSGGMARVHIGRRFGDGGFKSTVAIKRLAPQLEDVEGALEMLADEARIASRVSHANVVAVHDVVVQDGHLFLVMEHVLGASLLQLLQAVIAKKTRVPPEIARAIVVAILRGLDAAHEARGDDGKPLGVIHRDVAPSNVLVGVDGVPRLVDFGIAKAADRSTLTQVGERKGKLGFMSPEQLDGTTLDRRSDLYSVGVVYWESLTHKRLFGGGNEDEIRARVEHGTVAPPSSMADGATVDDDAIVLRALKRDRTLRFASAAEMADAIEQTTKIAPQSAVATFVQEMARDAIAARRKVIDEMNDAEPALWIGAIDGVRPRADAMLPPIDEKPPSVVPPAITAPAVSVKAEPPRARTASIAPGRGSMASMASVPPPAPVSGRAAFLFGGIGAALVVAAVVIVMTRAPAVATVEAGAPIATPAISTTESATPPTVSASAAPTTSASAPPKKKPRVGKSGCNPPFTIDAHGVKIYKEECFE